MNPRKRIDNAWNSIEEAVGNAKKSVSGRADTELGIFLHKNIGTMFIFDKKVREYEKEIIDFARNGEKNKAIATSQEMKNYILFEMKHNRRYKSRLKEVAGRLEGRAEKIQSFFSGLEGSELIDRVDGLNDSELENFEEELNREANKNGS